LVSPVGDIAGADAEPVFAEMERLFASEFVTIFEIGIFYLYQRLNNLSSIYVFIGRKPHRHLIRPPC